MKSALLVIDVQQCLCSGEHRTHEAEAVIERINRAADKTRAVGMPVFWIQHEAPEGLFCHGSASWQLARGLDARPGDQYLRKTTGDSFLRTDLHERLRAQGVERLAICGMHTEFCVDTTTRRALALGYPVLLLQDAHSTVDNAYCTAAQVIGHHNLTLANVTSFGPRATLVSVDAFDLTPA